uniref:Aminopeptidase n=1 Tax=Dicentrarchus labrax TaxID=13489 RepID=A0A8P4G8W2_DICLA
MAKSSFTSKAIASAFMILTGSVIAGIVTMVILYNTQISSMNPTPRPTFSTTTTGPPPVMRLPKNLIPETYTVFLKPHFYTRIIEEVNVTSPNQTMLFTGNSTVNFHCAQTTRTIYLNSKDLAVSKPKVIDTENNNNIEVSAMKHHEDESDFLEIQLKEALEAGGNYSLSLDFKGEISENLDALFVSTYQEGEPEFEGDTNTERFLVATNMEPTDARRVFPCFDEPEMKAVFYVTIIHRRFTKALGNEQQSASNIIDEDWQYTSFHPTPKMSTYLVAFTVSEFKPTPSTHERIQHEFHVIVFGMVLTLDQIALPDLSPAAMENWGLITYQEGGLLYEEGVSSLLHKEVIATLISHELAHQWFGNLVTMKWWNEVWLNEGFASYMSYFAVDHIDPSFKRDTFVMRDLHTAFEEDSLASSHPLSPPQEDVQETYQIIEMFDAITYSKVEILVMNTHYYANTDQNDLWDYIQMAVDEDSGHTKVALIMKPWTTQIGYPVITINTTDGGIYQKHFLFNDSSESKYVLWWHVPITAMSDTSGLFSFTLEDKPGNRIYSTDGEWILANVNCTGYYRVNYNPENWERLLTQLEKDPHRIPLMNRGQLIDDAFNLARAKLVDVSLALNSTRFLHNETAYIPWESAVRNLEYIVLMFDRSEVYGPMQAYLQEQVKGLYSFFRNYTYYSKVPEDHSLQRSQLLAIHVACSNGLPECIEMASKMFANWMNSNTTNGIHPNLRSVIYCQAVAAGGGKEWEFAWNKFQSSSDTSEKEQLRKALSCTKKIWLLNRYLEYTLDPEKIRLMDVASTINYIAKNVAGQALAWNFVRAHWDYVRQGAGAMLIEGVTSRFSTQFELKELEHFATDYELDSANRAVYQAIEQTKVNIEWVGEHKDVILEWFEGQTAL